MVERAAAAVEGAGLEVEGIDLVRLRHGPRARRTSSEGAVLYINVAGLTNVAVANAERLPLHARRRRRRRRDRHDARRAPRRSTLEHARQWIDHVGLAAPLDDVEGDAELVAAARASARGGRAPARRQRAQLAELLPRCRTTPRPVARGSSPAPPCSIPGFVEKLAEQLRLPLEVASCVDGRSRATEPGA